MSQQEFWKETLWPDVDAIGFRGNSGIILPSGSTTERPVPATAGHVRFNTDTNKSEIFDGFIWKGLGGGAGGGATAFTSLIDTPGSFAGAANQVVSVNNGETGLEFSSISSGATTFTELTDTPASLTGAANQIVSVNGSETGLEFTTAPQIRSVSYDSRISSGGPGPFFNTHFITHNLGTRFVIVQVYRFDGPNDRRMLSFPDTRFNSAAPSFQRLHYIIIKDENRIEIGLYGNSFDIFATIVGFPDVVPNDNTFDGIPDQYFATSGSTSAYDIYT